MPSGGTSGGTSVGGIYLRLGLNLSELETGFVEASRTVAQNISRLNRESNLIRLRSEVQIAGLDETADAERILQIRTNALNQQMAIQRDRVRILNAEYQNLVSAHGANSVAAQRAEVRLERERLALANLEREARNLNNSAGGNNSFFGELQDMLPSMPTKLEAVGLAFGAIATAVGGATAATKKLLDEFREVQKQSYELNMSFPDTQEFLREMRLAGGDIGDFEGYIRGITDAYVKGEYDDPEIIALRKYGAQITDATGRLKNFKDITEEVYQAWKKADEAGEGIEFLQLTGGEAGVRDAIQLFKRYEEAKEDAAKIFKAEIDDKRLHELDRTLNLVTEQSGELQKAIGSIFAPAAQAAGEKFFQTLHSGTAYIEENKDAIQRWGFIAAETFSTIAEKWGELSSYKMPDTGDPKVDKALDRLQWGASDFNDSALWGRNSQWSKVFTQLPRDIADSLGITQRAEERQREYNGELSETRTAAENAVQGVDKLSDSVQSTSDVLSQYGIQRVKQFKDELEDLQIELDFGDNDYQKAIAELDLWRKRELTDKLQVSDSEREAIENLYSARRELIDRERDDKVSEIYRSVSDDLRLNYEERQNLIAAEKEKFIAAGMDEAAAYQQAQDEINEKFKTSLDNRLAGIEEEKQKWISAGMDEAEAAQLAEQKRLKAIQEAHEKANQYIKNAADIEYGLTHTAFEKQIRDIEQWKDLMRQKAETEEEAAAVGAAAAAKEAEAFEAAMDRIKGKLQSLDDKIFAQEHSQYEQDMRRAQQERLRYYEDFQKEGMLNADTQARIERWYANEVSNLQKKFAEAQKSSSDYIKSPNGIMNSGGSPVGLISDENEIRRQYLATLPQETRERINAIDATRKLADAQNDLARQTNQTAANIAVIRGDQVETSASQAPDSDYTVIQGDQVTHLSHEDAAKIADLQRGQEQAFQQLQQTLELQPQQPPTSQLQPPTQQPIAEAQKNFVDSAKDFPPDYFRQLAEGTKAVSEMQGALIQSTLKLIDAQDKFAAALSNQPTRETSTATPDNGMMKLTATTDDLRDAQLRLADSTRDADARLRAVSDIPPNAPTAKKDDGFFSNPKAKFDMDTFSGIAQTGLEAVALLRMLGTLAPHPALKAATGVLGLAVGAGAGVGMYGHKLDENEQPQVSDDKLKPYVEADLSKLITPVVNIDGNVQNILAAVKPESADVANQPLPAETFATLANLDAPLTAVIQAVQESQTDEHLTELLGALPNIEAGVRDILAAIQLPQEEVNTSAHPADAAPIDYLTPLNAIDANVQSILTAIQPRETFDTSAQPTQESVDYLTPLANIDAKIQSILDTMQIQQETPVTFDTIVTPLNNISTIVGNILTALGNRKPTQINVSPHNNINLGGAYVFDNEMKKALVEDCTSQIVDNITAAVQQAISRSNYNYGA